MSTGTTHHNPGFSRSGFHVPTLASAAMAIALGMIGWDKMQEEPVPEAFRTIQEAYNLSEAELAELKAHTAEIARREGKTLATVDDSAIKTPIPEPIDPPNFDTTNALTDHIIRGAFESYNGGHTFKLVDPTKDGNNISTLIVRTFQLEKEISSVVIDLGDDRGLLVYEVLPRERDTEQEKVFQNNLKKGFNSTAAAIASRSQID